MVESARPGRGLSYRLGDVRPLDTKAAEVLSQAVGVVRLLPPLPRSSKQASTSFGERTALLAYRQHIGKLHAVEAELEAGDILTNCRRYPRDEAPAAYKDLNEVVHSVELAGLATEVAKLRARFVIKDNG